VREAEVADGDGLEGAQLHPAVGAVAGAVGDGHVLPGDGGAAVRQRGLVGLDREQVVRLLAGHQELSGVGVGVQRVGSPSCNPKVWRLVELAALGGYEVEFDAGNRKACRPTDGAVLGPSHRRGNPSSAPR
jgi:hypothetical protein